MQEPLFEELGDGFLVTMFRKPTNQTNQGEGISQIVLEATDMGRPLYERYRFKKMEDEMKLV